MATPVSIGASVAGGIFNAMGAGVKGQGEQTAIAGQMLSTIGKAFQFDVEKQQYEFKSLAEQYQAAVAKINQQIAKQNANYELETGEVEAQQVGMESRYRLGQMLANQGASGIDVSSGSATKIREGMIDIGYHDQAMTRANAARLAYGSEVQATQYEAQAAIHSFTAAMDDEQAKNAGTAAGLTRSSMSLLSQASENVSKATGLNIMSSLVGGVGSVAGKWTTGSFQGMFGGSKT
jgi:hypothetical protein